MLTALFAESAPIVWSIAERPYRIAALLVMLMTMSVTIRFRRQAGRTGEKITYHAEGHAFAGLLRFAGIALWLSLIAYLVAPRSVQWAAVALPAEVRWTGVVIGMGAALLMYWTLRALGENLTDTVMIRSNAFLVTEGPYRWVRHPFYITAGLVMFAVTLLSANGLIGVTAAIVIALLAIRTPNEEQQLIKRFGDEYRRYMQQTGRFVPRLRRC